MKDEESCPFCVEGKDEPDKIVRQKMPDNFKGLYHFCKVLLEPVCYQHEQMKSEAKWDQSTR